jgi:hypothetical protein
MRGPRAGTRTRSAPSTTASHSASTLAEAPPTTIPLPGRQHLSASEEGWGAVGEQAARRHEGSKAWAAHRPVDGVAAKDAHGGARSAGVTDEARARRCR